jgi:hypothetical protein
MMQILAVNQSKSPDEWIQNIETLDDLTCSRQDKEYRDDLKGASNQLKSLVNLDALVSGKEGKVEIKMHDIARKKYRALISLADRRGWLIEENAHGEDEDDTEYDTPNPSPAEGG